MFYIGTNNPSYFGIGDGYVVDDVKVGPAIVLPGLTGDRDILQNVTTFTPNEDVGTIIIRSPVGVTPQLTLILGDDGTSVEWVDSTLEATLDAYRFTHKVIIRISPTDYNDPNVYIWWDSRIIWTETPTRRKVWRREGNTIVADETLLPSKIMRDLNNRNVDGLGPISGFTTEIPVTDSRVLPFVSDVEALDGAWFKLSIPAYPNIGTYIFDVNLMPGFVRAWTLLDIVPFTADPPLRPFAYYAMQLERQRDQSNVPTGEWKIRIDEYFGYIGTVPYTGANDDDIYIVAQAPGDASIDITPENFLWEISFDTNNGTIRFENADLKRQGVTNRFWGFKGVSGDNDFVSRCRDSANAVDFVFDVLFLPDQYEFQRYDVEGPLTGQCCADRVTEENIPPIGFGTPINYRIFCPAAYAPSIVPSSTNFVLPANSVACDDFITTFCAATENKDDPVCGCINLTDLPLLPDNATINAYDYCFSNNCRNFGYIPTAIQDGNGDLNCPDTILCDELKAAEDIEGDIYNEAQDLLGCPYDPNPDPDPDPDPEPPTDEGGLSVLWISVIVAGSVVVLALIIGLSVGIPAAQRDKEKKEEEERQKLERQKQLQQRASLERTLLGLR